MNGLIDIHLQAVLASGRHIGDLSDPAAAAGRTFLTAVEDGGAQVRNARLAAALHHFHDRWADVATGLSPAVEALGQNIAAVAADIGSADARATAAAQQVLPYLGPLAMRLNSPR